MSEFHYNVKRTEHFTLDYLTIEGKTIQDGTPAPETPADINVVESISISLNGETVATIDLQGNTIAALPDGTHDTLHIDSYGNVTLTKATEQATIDGVNIYATDRSVFGTNARAAMRALPNQANASNNSKRLNCYNDRFIVSALPVNSPATGAYNFELYNNLSFAVLPIADISENSVSGINNWFASHETTVLYPRISENVINLGTIDMTPFQDIQETPALSIVSALNPAFDYEFTNNPTYELLNPYETIETPDVVFPPRHFGQEWEVFEPDKWSETEMFDYTGQRETHSVYGIQLCELIESGVFDWSKPYLDWSSAAYSPEQYERFCNYFVERFYFRDIGITPFKVWANYLHRMLVYELMPKYKPLYNQVESGISPLGENEYHKRRTINSAYPETQLSGNSDYITDGIDVEGETIHIKNAGEAMQDYMREFISVDTAIADELEVLFVCMYTSYVNAL